MGKYCVISNTDKDIDGKYARQVCDIFKDHGLKCVDITRYDNRDEEENYIDKEKLSGDYEVAVVLGGDGTIIRTARELAGLRIPMLGINIGTLGYLAEVESNELEDAVLAVINNKYHVEERMMLEGSCILDEKEIETDIALNDIVISRNGYSRIISTNVYVNNELVDEFKGDGIMVSTPTGSTGYNLSAGGPIVKHNTSLMIITPICPHTRASRSIIISDEDEIMIEIVASKKTRHNEVIASFDGRSGIKLGQDDKIIIRKAQLSTRLVVIKEKRYFEVVSKKL